MKEKKKEKRYFVDWFDCEGKCPSAFFQTSAIVLIPLIICIIISCNMGMTKYGNELNSYSATTYNILESIATLTIKEGYIDTSLLPDNIAEYDIHYNSKDKTIVYTYSLDNNSDMQYIPTPYMNITLSEKYEILSEDCIYSSEEKYVNSIKSSIYFNSFLIGSCFWLCIVFVDIIIGFIAYHISKAHKKRDSEIDSSDIDDSDCT